MTDNALFEHDHGPGHTYRHQYRRPGVCSVCGCAVVQPEVQPAHGVWSHGHVFDFPSKGQHKEPVLVDVRCPRHLPAWYNDCGCGR